MSRARIEAWLASRQPARPDALATQMSSLIAACPDAELGAASSIAAIMGSLGIFSVARVNGQRPASADLALDLLAADAFVTYAFEAAAEEGVDMVPLAMRLLRAA